MNRNSKHVIASAKIPKIILMKKRKTKSGCRMLNVVAKSISSHFVFRILWRIFFLVKFIIIAIVIRCTNSVSLLRFFVRISHFVSLNMFAFLGFFSYHFCNQNNSIETVFLLYWWYTGIQAYNSNRLENLVDGTMKILECSQKDKFSDV